MTKTLKLKDEDRVSPEERAELFGRSRIMAEMAYKPPAQQDVFKPSMAIDAAGKKLLAFFERIEHLDEMRTAIVSDIAEVFAEAKSEGFDVAAMRALLKIRSDDDAEAKLAMLKLYHDRIAMKVWPE